MMMAMLEAGGIPPLVDDHRPADESNRNGYYEYEPVLASRESVAWVPAAKGKAVKVIYALLESLPPGYEYRVIFMMRDVGEVVESQQKMLLRLGREGAAISPEELQGIFTRERDRSLNWLASQSNFQVLKVDYGQAISTPAECCRIVDEFLGNSLDGKAMSKIASPELRTVSRK